MAEDTRSLKDRLLYTSSAPNDDCNRMPTVANHLILYIHPTKVSLPALRLSYTWDLGGNGPVLNSQQILTRNTDEQLRAAIVSGGRRPAGRPRPQSHPEHAGGRTGAGSGAAAGPHLPG